MCLWCEKKRLLTRSQTRLLEEILAHVSSHQGCDGSSPGSVWRVTDRAAQRHRYPGHDDTNNTSPCGKNKQRHTAYQNVGRNLNAVHIWSKTTHTKKKPSIYVLGRKHLLTQEDVAEHQTPPETASPR